MIWHIIIIYSTAIDGKGNTKGRIYAVSALQEIKVVRWSRIIFKVESVLSVLLNLEHNN